MKYVLSKGKKQTLLELVQDKYFLHYVTTFFSIIAVMKRFFKIYVKTQMYRTWEDTWCIQAIIIFKKMM